MPRTIRLTEDQFALLSANVGDAWHSFEGNDAAYILTPEKVTIVDERKGIRYEGNLTSAPKEFPVGRTSKGFHRWQSVHFSNFSQSFDDSSTHSSISGALTLSATEVRFLETSDISSKPDQIEQLEKFICAHAQSNNEDMQTAICSAIRKYVMNVSVEQLGALTEHLAIDGVIAHSVNLVQEMLKALTWRLTNVDESALKLLCNLRDCISEIVDTYCQDRLIKDSKQGALLLNAVTAYILLQGDAHSMLVRLDRLKSRWFIKMLAQRLKQMPIDSARDFVKSLNQ